MKAMPHRWLPWALVLGTAGGVAVPPVVAPAQDAPSRQRTQPKPAAPPTESQEIGDVITIPSNSKGVTFTVVDDQNRLVNRLKQNDVEVFDGGVRQEIDIFRQSNDLPIMLAVVIDTSASQESLLPTERRAVDFFLDSFFRQGKDYGAILTFQGETSLVNGLCSDLRQLKTSLGRVEREQRFRDEDGGTPPLGTALYDAIDIAAHEVLNGKTAQRVTNVKDPRAQDNAKRAIRRAMCILTDGKDTASQKTLAQAVGRAQRLGIAIYILGLSDQFRYGEIDRDSIERICAKSGGKAFFPTNETDLERNFKEIVSDLSGQYILVYRPTGGASDGDGRRAIKIVPRNRSLRIFHQTEYDVEQ
jgi:Ca-activated chloride channel homolog